MQSAGQPARFRRVRGIGRIGAVPVTAPDEMRRGPVAWMTGLGFLAIVATIVFTVSVVADRNDDVDRAEATATAERAIDQVVVGISGAAVTLERTAVSVCEGESPSTDPTVLSELTCIRPDGSLRPRSPRVQEVLDAPEVATALARARDGGTTVLSGPVGGDGTQSVIAAPVYATADGMATIVAPALSTVTRRDAEIGIAVGALDAGALVELTTPWQLTDGSVRLAGAESLSGTTVQSAATVLGRQLTLTTVVPGGNRQDTAPWTLGGLGLLGVALLGGAIWSDRRALRRRSEQTQLAEERAAAIQSLTGNIQQGQDLAEILPALAVQLSDELDLAGFSLSLAGSGAPRLLFVHGVVPDAAVVPTAGRPEVLAPGTSMAVDLHRSDRSIAVMRVVAGAPLGPSEIDLIHVAGEMIASTIVSARSLEQQQEAVSRLEALDELKTAFLGVASHELRTPATAISGLASMLSGRWDAFSDEERQVFAQRIATNGNALNGLVQDLLDFARLERGDFELALETIDLSDTVERVLDRLEPVWSSHHVDRSIEPDVLVRGDASAVDRIVTNLVSNAVKFSPEGSAVEVTVERHHGRVRLVVDDAGPGVPEEERERIFVRFYRGAGDAVVRTRGVGIGLSVVQDFVQQMAGDIRVETSPAGGARFVVGLDAVEPAAAQEERDVAST